MASFESSLGRIPSWENWRKRYPLWCHGYAEWNRQFIENGTWGLPSLPEPLKWSERISNPPAHGLQRPRAFVSHRQGDTAYAERVAYLLDREGFDYWLDAVDMPKPSVVAKMSAQAVALQIEMALLNCTHIVAVYTDKTPGSTWVPYEYGRVKQGVLSSTQCCTWFSIRDAQTVVPEWLELNKKCCDEADLVRWIKSELNKWKPSGLSKPSGRWSKKTSPLPLCS